MHPPSSNFPQGNKTHGAVEDAHIWTSERVPDKPVMEVYVVLRSYARMGEGGMEEGHDIHLGESANSVELMSQTMRELGCTGNY
jgi:hypothetical protein